MHNACSAFWKKKKNPVIGTEHISNYSGKGLGTYQTTITTKWLHTLSTQTITICNFRHANSHIRTTTRHQNQIQLIALPPRHGNPKVPHLPNYQDTPRHWKSVGKTLFLGFPISSTLRGPGRLPLLIARASLAPIIDSNPREPTLPGGQPGTRRNKQTNNSTSKVKVLTS